MELFKGHDQFINWIPKLLANGKTTKIPVGIEGNAINPLDPVNWVTQKQAEDIAAHTNLQVGFVFTENDPYFFVDIDNAVVEDTWSLLAKNIVTIFGDCAVEISNSGRGLHIFGRGTGGPGVNKDKFNGLEFYIKKRFVALTGTIVQGTTETDGTVGLRWLTENYFKKQMVPDRSGIWTTEPVTEWNGEIDDKKLLARAMKDRRPSVVFGAKISFGELFNRDENKLNKFFPAENGFNASDAELALCTHLAYWTGKNCERIERLFNLSELAGRDKWNDRDQYREETILLAVNGVNTVHKRRDPIGAVPAYRSGSQFLDLEAQLSHFKDCVYVISRRGIFSKRYGLLKSEQFKVVYGGYDFSTRFKENKPCSNPFEAFTESQIYDFPVADGTVFRPENSELIIKEEGLSYVNTYIPVAVDSVQGDSSPFTGLLKKILPDERDRILLLSYMAACIQFPGEKFQWAPLIQGVEGNGKTFLGTVVTKAVGEKYTHLPEVTDLNSRFTGWIEEKLFIIIEELFISGNLELSERLKPLITNTRIPIQHKGADQRTGDNRANFFLCSNYKDAVTKTKNDRRYCVLYSAQQKKSHLQRDGMTQGYFPKLYQWARSGGYAIITDYLRNYKIKPEYNPALNYGGLAERAPETSSTPEALALSLSSVEQEIIEAIREEQAGFRDGWISSIAAKILLKERLTPRKLREIMENIGYIYKCRMNNPSPLDAERKPTLYIRKDRKDLRILQTGKETENKYLKAQGFR